MKIFNGFRRRLFGTGFGKYLLYALGEIILVVIGILLAISINNHYQQKAVKEKTKEVTQQIYQQMISDTLRIREYQDYLSKLDSAITHFRLPVKERKLSLNPLKDVNKLILFVDRDKDLLEVSNLVATQIQSYDFSTTNYAQLLYNVQTDYNVGMKRIQSQEAVILNNNKVFNNSLKKYDWFILWSSKRRCANDCINFVVHSDEFNTHLAILQYEKTYIYQIRIHEFLLKLRKHIHDLKNILSED